MDRMLSEPEAMFTTMLRRVADKRGTEIYGGALSEAELSESSTRLGFDMNELRFEYAASSFGPEDFREYQHMLEGFDDDWSPWSTENRTIYTNLPPRSYRFRVRARNGTGRMGTEAVYPFSISPPWYRTKLAYLFYVIAVVLGIFAIVKWRSYSLERTNVRLEKLVTERTAALKKSNEAIQESLAEIKMLQGIIPICAGCKKVRSDKGYWEQVEVYVSKHSDAEFSHGMCPSCMKDYYSGSGYLAEDATKSPDRQRPNPQ